MNAIIYTQTSNKGSRSEISTTLATASIQHPFGIHSASIGTRWKAGGKLLRFAAMMCLLLMLGVGQMWGASVTLTLSDNSTDTWTNQGKSGGGTAIAMCDKTVTGISISGTSGYCNTSNSYTQIYSGSDITITSTAGNMTSVSFNCTGSNSNNYSPSKFELKSGSAGSYSQGTSGAKVGTWTGNATTFTLHANAQVRVTSITITYTAATYNVYLMSGCTGGSYSSNKGTSGSGTGAYSSCTKYSGISAGTSVTITATPSSGYDFDGWEDSGYSIIFDDDDNEITPSSSTSTTATFTMPSKDVVIWQCNFSESCANSVTISKGTGTNCTFTLSPSGAQASCSGVTTTISITPTTGYGTPVVTQSGASSTPTPGGSGNTQTLTYGANTTGTSTINVSCSANNYTINLNTDLTPTSAGTTSITATYNANTNLTSAITKPTKTGWTFGGYFTGKNGTGTQIIDASGNVIASAGGGSTYTDASKNWKYANNITLYAKWTCTVTWSVNGLTNVYSTQTVTYNSSGSKVASIPGPPSPASYCGDKFMGWSAKSAGAESKTTSYYDDLFTTVGDSPDIKSIGDITFYAVFANYAD